MSIGHVVKKLGKMFRIMAFPVTWNKKLKRESSNVIEKSDKYNLLCIMKCINSIFDFVLRIF